MDRSNTATPGKGWTLERLNRADVLARIEAAARAFAVEQAQLDTVPAAISAVPAWGGGTAAAAAPVWRDATVVVVGAFQDPTVPG